MAGFFVNLSPSNEITLIDDGFPNNSDVLILLKWFSSYGKVYPWTVESNGSPNPYAVWISEVMLQQTTVSVVLPRYQQWMKHFPDMDSLAHASTDDVLREWEGLGYYSRAKNLHMTAKEVCCKYGGKLPKKPQELQKLPGIGEYIASAVSSFAHGEKTIVIEANVRRIVQRLRASENWNKTLEMEFKTRTEKNISKQDSRKFNAAIMQFGQQVCLPRKPNCDICPLRERCKAASSRIQDKIPTRRRQKLLKKTTELALIVEKLNIWIFKRASGIGAGLWVFPAHSELTNPSDWLPIASLETEIHAYTRFRDELKPTIFHRDINKSPIYSYDKTPTPTGKWVSMKRINDIGMPSAYKRIANNLYLYLKRSTI